MGVDVTSQRVLWAQPIVPGAAEGVVLATAEPLSFWGGYDYHTGQIIDRRHPLVGQVAAGRVLAVPFTRGSSTTTAVLLEAVRAGTAPAAILTTGIDSFFALASIVADVMYGRAIPVLALAGRDFAGLRTGEHLRIEADGTIWRTEPDTDDTEASPYTPLGSRNP